MKHNTNSMRILDTYASRLTPEEKYKSHDQAVEIIIKGQKKEVPGI